MPETLKLRARGQVEGLGEADGTLSALQEAFREHHALQCGFCTPGFLTTLTQLINDDPDIDEAKLRRELSGNICRCTGYSGIVKAALQVARGRAAKGGGA